MCRRSIISGGDEIFLNSTDTQDISYIKHHDSDYSKEFPGLKEWEGNIVKPKVKEKHRTEIIEEELKSISSRLDSQHEHDMKLIRMIGDINEKLSMYDSRLKRLEEHVYGKDGAGLIRVMSNIETIKDKLEKEEYDEDGPVNPKFVEKAIKDHIEKGKEDQLLKDIGNYYGLKNSSSTMKETEEKKELLKPVVSYTTRPMRESEVNGKEHIFITEEDLKFTFDEREFAAYTEINGYKYFTTFQQLRECNVYIIDPDGLFSLIRNKRCDFDIFVIYIYAPMDVRYERYINREGKDKLELSKEFIKRESSENKQFTIFEENILNYSSKEHIEGDVSFSNWNKVAVGTNYIKDIYNIPEEDFVYSINYSIFPNYAHPFQLMALVKKIEDTCKNKLYKNPLFCFVGRTSSGKDTICRKIMDYVNN